MAILYSFTMRLMYYSNDASLKFDVTERYYIEKTF